MSMPMGGGGSGSMSMPMGGSSTSTSAPAAAAATPVSAPVNPLASSVDKAKVAAYCGNPDAAKTAACSVWKACQAAGDKAPAGICGSTAIAALACKPSVPVGAADLCAAYTATCSSDSTKCVNVGWPGMWSTDAVASGVDSICKEMPKMAGCDKCMPSVSATKGTTCAAFDTYAQLCNDMPGMSQCGGWTAMCASAPNAAATFPKLCDGEAMAAAKVTFNASAWTAASGSSSSSASTSPTATPKTGNGASSSVVFAATNAMLVVVAAVAVALA
ncbi:hypothetical protein BC828DRAFT_401994 [Blastocladiella britannica]|nr:hypothetical protein BC828DRAFT_401994 [Blastocladiella britannica]